MRMKTEELIQKLHDHPRSTEVLLMFNEESPTHWTDAAVYGQTFKLVIGEWDSLRPQLQAQKDRLRDVRLVCPQRHSAWILEGVRGGHSAGGAAGAVVTEDVPPGWLAAGVPARLIKRKDEQTRKKTVIVEKLRDSSR